MAIKPLSQSVCHLLGSTQTLTNAYSLIKELVDNSLDAKATAIDVLISKDTLEKIEVRDNGHGISKDDFDALGRRGHTSKLTSFEELRSIGGVSLGFRGEALASAVQLGQVTITTKTDGEAVASCLSIRYPGGISEQSKTSHPVGTTVSIKHFLSKIPVREKTAKKAAPKTLVQIKELLQAYAFARPHVKFVLRVIKESKGGWSYVPKKSEGIKSAATQIVGREVVAECMEQTFSFYANTSFGSRLTSNGVSQEDAEDVEISSKKDRFVIEMILPKPGVDTSKISCRQFLSVDGRPVASDKGTIKKIVSTFKTCLKRSYDGPHEGVKNAFLRMNIKCPIASYDPNVEPAKDDIIFANELLILEAFENQFGALYGEASTDSRISLTPKPVEIVEDFDLLPARPSLPSSKKDCSLARKHNVGQREFHCNKEFQPALNNIAEDYQTPQGTAGYRHNKRGVDMTKDLSENVDAVQLPQEPMPPWQSEFQNDDESTNIPSRGNELNPWVIAKLTAPPRPTPDSQPDLPLLADDREDSANFLPTPMPSSDSVNQPRGMRSARSRSTQDGHPIMNENVSVNAYPHTNHPINTNLVYNIVSHPHHAIQCTSDGDYHKETYQENDVLIPPPKNDFMSARNVTEADIIEPTIPESIKLPKKSNSKTSLNKPFVSPLLSLDAPLARDNMRQSTLGIAKQLQTSVPEAGLIEQEQHEADLAWAMDFEHRKEELARQQRIERRASRRRLPIEDEDVDKGESVKRLSPHKNRYLAAAAALDVDMTINYTSPTKNPKSLIPDGDPRSYFIKRQKSMVAQPNKMTRLKSHRLPLERIPAGSQLNAVALNLKVDTALIKSLVQRLGRHDGYDNNGLLVEGLPLMDGDEDSIIRKVEELAMAWKGRMTEGDVEFDFAIRELSEF